MWPERAELRQNPKPWLIVSWNRCSIYFLNLGSAEFVTECKTENEDTFWEKQRLYPRRTEGMERNCLRGRCWIIRQVRWILTFLLSWQAQKAHTINCMTSWPPSVPSQSLTTCLPVSSPPACESPFHVGGGYLALVGHPTGFSFGLHTRPWTSIFLVLNYVLFLFSIPSI